MRIYVCTYVFLYVGMYVYVCMYACKYILTYVRMYACAHVRMCYDTVQYRTQVPKFSEEIQINLILYQ